MDFSSPLALRLRRIGQELHILRPVVRVYRKIIAQRYEQDFETLLLSRIAAGDVIWDVGANTGFYTRKFAEAVGAAGHVIAFEPSPRNFSKLSADLANWPNTTLKNFALSNFEGTAMFYSGDSVDGVTDSLEGGGDGVSVGVATGDAFSPSPSVIKIDVEGFELEVLLGMSKTLMTPTLRDVFIEIHFLTMAKRGAPDNPTKIVDLLKNAGFQIKWTDPSHIWASRTLQ